jgi:hypothetical protein
LIFAGVLLFSFSGNSPLTALYSHFKTSVLPIIVNAAPTNKKILCVCDRRPKRGYGYLNHQSISTFALLKKPARIRTHHPLWLKQCSTHAQYTNAIPKLSPIAGLARIVHGGLSASKSNASTAEGIRWKPISAQILRSISGGTTSSRSMAEMLQ